MKAPWDWTEDDILSLIQNKVSESTTLEYKACDALVRTEGKKNEISKDVSAFANSAGGAIVYGVTENSAHEPEAIDSGFDPSDISGEWLEQVINSTIERRISGIIIKTVALPKTRHGKVLYVVSIPESNLAPHMAADDRFYRRFNFQRVSMKEYEVRNLMRQEHYPSTEIVCAWRDYVIYSLLSILEKEKEYLEQAKWDSREHSLRISSISNRDTYSPNQEQFLESYPEIQESMDAHDEAVSNLITRWGELFQAVKHDGLLLNIYSEGITSQSLQELKALHHHEFEHCKTDEDIVERLFGQDADKEDHLAMIAEYIINAWGNVTSHPRYTEPFWNAHQGQFLNVLNNQPVTDCLAQVNIARKELLDRIESLIALLKKILFELSKQHGIPVERTKDVQYVYRDYGFY